MKISDRQPKISDSLKISDFSDSPLAPQQYAYVGHKHGVVQSVIGIFPYTFD